MVAGNAGCAWNWFSHDTKLRRRRRVADFTFFFLARSEATSTLLINININISIKRKNDAAVAVPPERCLKWNICMLELRRTKVNKTWRCQLCCRCEEVTKGGLGGRTKQAMRSGRLQRCYDSDKSHISPTHLQHLKYCINVWKIQNCSFSIKKN